MIQTKFVPKSLKAGIAKLSALAQVTVLHTEQAVDQVLSEDRTLRGFKLALPVRSRVRNFSTL